MTKKCIKCNKDNNLDMYHSARSNKDGLNNVCRTCRASIARDRYRKDPFKQLIRSKKSECIKKHLAFNITDEYLRAIWTGICPITNENIRIGVPGRGSHRSAHLDRLDSKKGYIIGNVNFINSRSNRIKYDASLEELKEIVYWMECQIESATTIPKGSTP